MKTDTQIIHRFLNETRDCAMQMMQNAAYIQKELPSLTMPDPLRAKIMAACDELIGTKHDLIHDVFEISELMENSPEPAELGRRVESIKGMIFEATMTFHDCVRSVPDAIKAGHADALVSILLTESGFNILNAVPTYPDLEDENGDVDESEEEDDEEDDEEDPNADCFAFQSEDAWPVGRLSEVIHRLGERPELDSETRENLRVFHFAMERLPLFTPGIRMTLGLRLDQGGDSDWIEIRIEDDEFSLGRGRWVDGDADTETVFEVGAGWRDGDAFIATQFADSFCECAKDLCRSVVIENNSDTPFTDWELPLGKARWSDLPCSFL